MAHLKKTTSWIPIFELESDPDDHRYGSIKIRTAAAEYIGELDYFYGFSEEVFEQEGRSRAFIIANILCCGKYSETQKALLFMAACLADSSDEDRLYIKDRHANRYEPLSTVQLLRKQRAVFEER